MTDLEPLSPAREAAIRTREEAATKGPWLVEDDHTDLNRWVVSEDSTLTIGFGYVGNRTQDDAEFTAHAREDVPALLAELDRVRAESSPDRAAVLRAVEDAVYEYRELMCQWGETDGSTQEIARRVTQAALDALGHRRVGDEALRPAVSESSAEA